MCFAAFDSLRRWPAVYFPIFIFHIDYSRASDCLCSSNPISSLLPARPSPGLAPSNRRVNVVFGTTRHGPRLKDPPFLSPLPTPQSHSLSPRAPDLHADPF